MTVKKYWIRAGIVGIILLVSLAIYASSKQVARNGRIQSEVSMLQNEAEKVRRENETLSEKIRYFSSTDFQEQEAKEKLGMKKNQEEAVIIQPQPESLAQETPEPLMAQTPRVTGIHGETTNYQKWWAAFFGPTE